MTPAQLYAWVKDNKEVILADKRQGNSNAGNIVTLYNMLVNYADSAALGLLTEAVKDYRREKGM